MYTNTLSLIATKRPEMLPAFKKLVNNNSAALVVANYENNRTLIKVADEITTDFVKVYDYDMYKISNRMKVLQQIYDHNLVQVWYDAVLGDIPVLSNPQSKSLLSECRMMKCGMSATVVADLGYRDITVKFDDGSLVEHCSRKQFLNGTVKNPRMVIEEQKDDMVGKIFGGLKIINNVDDDIYRCRCGCGNTIDVRKRCLLHDGSHQELV